MEDAVGWVNRISVEELAWIRRQGVADSHERDLAWVIAIGGDWRDGDWRTTIGHKEPCSSASFHLLVVHLVPTLDRQTGVTGFRVPCLDAGPEGRELDFGSHGGDSHGELLDTHVQQVCNGRLFHCVEFWKRDNHIAVVVSADFVGGFPPFATSLLALNEHLDYFFW